MGIRLRLQLRAIILQPGACIAQAPKHLVYSPTDVLEFDMVAMSRILLLEMSLDALFSIPNLRLREEIDHHATKKTNNPVNVNERNPEDRLYLMPQVTNHKDLGHAFSLLRTICATVCLKLRSLKNYLIN